MDYCNICNKGGRQIGPYITYKIDGCSFRKCNPCYTKEGLAEIQREREIKEAPRAAVLALQSLENKFERLIDAITKVNEKVAYTEGCPVEMYCCRTCNHYSGLIEYNRRGETARCHRCDNKTLKRVVVLRHASYTELREKETAQHATQDASSGP